MYKINTQQNQGHIKEQTKMRFKIIAIICVALFVGCNSSIDPEGDIASTYQIEGMIDYDSTPLSDAIVQVQGESGFVATTNASGVYRLDGLESGKHIIEVSKDFGHSVFSKRMDTIEVIDTDVILDMTLPRHVSLHNPDTVHKTYIGFTWEVADSSGFKDYSILRYPSQQNFDRYAVEIYTTTAILDTSYTDQNLLPDSRYTYQLVVSYDGLKTAGSNLISARTLEDNMILNSHFSIISPETGFPQGWWCDDRDGISAPSANITLDSSEFSSPPYSVKMNFNINSDTQMSVYQEGLIPNEFEPGEEYRLAVKFKAYSSIPAFQYAIQMKLINGENQWGNNGWYQNSMGWMLQELPLTLSEDFDINEETQAAIVIMCEQDDVFFWVDDIVIQKATP